MSDQKLATNYSERLHNEDLAPVEERTWSTYSLFAMWMGGALNHTERVLYFQMLPDIQIRAVDRLGTLLWGVCPE